MQEWACKGKNKGSACNMNKSDRCGLVKPNSVYSGQAPIQVPFESWCLHDDLHNNYCWQHPLNFLMIVCVGCIANMSHHRFLFAPGNIRGSQNDFTLLCHYAKEASDDFHL